MNTKNNRRKRESRERIEAAFVHMLQERELHEITVSEICKTCSLNRSTFYANYLDVYDLADRIGKQLEEEVIHLYAEETRQGFNSNDYLRLFRHIRDHQAIYATYFKLGFEQRHVVERYDTEQAEKHFEGRFIDYHIEFFRSGFNAIVKKWIECGCRETPEEMNEIILSEYRGRERLAQETKEERRGS